MQKGVLYEGYYAEGGGGVLYEGYYVKGGVI